MSEGSFKDECSTLLKLYLNEGISTEKFINDFVDLWRRYRKWRYAIKETWPEPYDQQLIKAAFRHEISAEELSRGLLELFGETTLLEKMIEFIHSALSLYSPTPTLAYEFNEDGLRDEVKKAIKEYRFEEGE